MQSLSILASILITICAVIAVAVFLLAQAWVPMVIAAAVAVFAPRLARVRI